MRKFNLFNHSSGQEERQITTSCLSLYSDLPLTCPLQSLHKMLILCMLLFAFGGMNVWGGTTTYTSRTSAGSDKKKIESTDSWVANLEASYNDDGAYWGCNSNSKTITLTCTNISDPITEIVVNGKRNKANFTYTISATVGGSTFGTTFSKSGKSTYTTNTLSNSNGMTGTVILTITAAGASSQGGSIWVTSIQVTTAASCSVNPTVGDIMNNVTTYTATGATFTTSAGVSAGSNCSLNEVGFVYSTSTNPTITTGTKATISNYSSGNLSKTVTGLNDNTTYYVRAFATNGHGTAYSDEKSFKTLELAKYTVQFSTGEGNPTRSDLTEASAGAGITLPTAVVPHCSGWTFAGWSATNVASETTTAPTLLTAGTTYHPTEDCTLHAVYSRSETGSGVEFARYELVTSAPTNWEGQYILSTGTKTATGEYASNALTYESSTPGTTELAAKEFTLTKVANQAYYTLTNANGLYIGVTNANSSKTNLVSNNGSSLTTHYYWNPSTSYLQNEGSSRFLGDNGSTCFKAYVTDNVNSNTPAKLYKRIEETPTVTYYLSAPDCCESLAQVEGSANLSLWNAGFIYIEKLCKNSF